LAAALHAAWNALAKSGKDPLLSITAIHLAKGIVILPLVALVGFPDSDVWPYLIASMIFHFGYYVALSESYRFGDFSEAYPVARGTAPIMVTFWGVFVLAEELSTIEMLSLAGVIIGILIFATRRFGRVVHNNRTLLAALRCTWYG
jgi:drug/metabolite transporter (DMT)-like permease